MIRVWWVRFWRGGVEANNGPGSGSGGSLPGTGGGGGGAGARGIASDDVVGEDVPTAGRELARVLGVRLGCYCCVHLRGDHARVSSGGGADFN